MARKGRKLCKTKQDKIKTEELYRAMHLALIMIIIRKDIY